MQSKATTVAQYLAELPPDRRAAIKAVRAVILANIDPQFGEGMQYGMICWHVPRSIYPAGYHCDPKQPLPFIGLASQKQYMSLYLSCDYSSDIDDEWFREQWAATGKKLDMGKCCIRFKKLEALALDLIGTAVSKFNVRDYIANYEKTLKRK